MDAEETGSGKEDEPEQEVNSEADEDDGAGPSTSSGNSQSSNRHMRNMAEKMRRDKLNFFITELSTLVPIISFSPKKLDKTSILRLAATYIRLHNVIFGSVRRDTRRSSVHRQMMEYLPQYLASFNWSENVLEEMDGMLMIVNGAGRIIFISHTVEKLLGHTQIELMGQSLYNLTCLEDYDELKRNLAPDDDPANIIPGDCTGDESSSDSSSCPATPPPRMPTLPFHLDSEGSDHRLRRSFYIRLRQRAQSRSDQPQYELVHVVGHLRVPPPRTQANTSRRTNQPANHNDVILVAVVKPFKEKRITTLSLMEACREEFITRHTLDGRIIYTDHRISIVAGYLSEEVCGIPGFQYMHKEDMRWTMVGLRQMFFRGSSYGQSCYRLQTKNGEFIYLKTCGYLELSENNDSFQSLICINSLVSESEGEELIRQMKEQFSPVIKNKSDRSMAILAPKIHGAKEEKGETEDPKVMEAAINHMMSNVPPPAPFMSSVHSPPANNIDPTEPQFAKATLAAKAMPPLSTQVKKIGIVPPIIRTPAAMQQSLSPPSSQSQHSPPLKHSPPPPQQPPPQQNRPSVLRVAHRQGDHSVLQPVSLLKRCRSAEDTPEERLPKSPRSVVVSPAGSSCSSGFKRRSEDSCEWPSSSPLQVDVSMSPMSSITTSPAFTVPPTPMSIPPASLSPPSFQLESVDQLPQLELLSAVDDNDILGDFRISDDVSSPSLVSTMEDIGLPEMYSLGLWPGQEMPEMPQMLESSHRGLDSRMTLQGEQICEIQQDLQLLSPENTNGQVYNTKLSQLQVEHRKQQQMLKTLQQDHQSIHNLGVCNSQQNVGV